MGFLLAEAAACLSTLGVLATKLLVDVNGRTLHFEIAKRTFRKKVQAGRFQVFHLLHVL